jgi:hypothetical protein
MQNENTTTFNAILVKQRDKEHILMILAAEIHTFLLMP